MLPAMAAFLSCLIVGCGYVGSRLARAESGRRPVLAIVRSGPNATALQAAGINTMRLDLDATEPELQPTLATAASDAAVVYLVPPPESGTTDPRLEAFLRRLGDEATPSVFVYVSTTGVYGHTGGTVVDEATPVAPGNDRARRRVAAEGAATSWCAARGVRSVVLRVPGIYGPNRLPLDRLERGEAVLRPDEAGPGNRIHVDDLVTTMVAAIDRPEARGVYNVSDGDHSSTTVYLQETARAAGLREPALVSRAEAATRISPGMLAFLLESRRVDNRRMREELGVRPLYPNVRAGIHASLAEMRMEESSS
jgi:nucleoside-diphosphate-sugar epimerase